MIRTYRIRGSIQTSQTSLAPGSIAITSKGRLLPGSARDAGVGEYKAESDEVVRLELENGFVLWTRADDLVKERGRKTLGRDGTEGWEIDLRGSAASTRGMLGLGIKALEFFGVDLKGNVASSLGGKAELKQLGGNAPGLYRCPLDAPFGLTPVTEATLPAEPMLVFLHGTGSSTQGSFGELWEGKTGETARLALKAQYGDQVYALEHCSLTTSPIQNALDLASRLPEGAQLHLVSHSRGGLVGELLCLGERNKTEDPLRTELLDTLFAADRTVAEQLGLSPLSPDAMKVRDQAYTADRGRLKDLVDILDKKQVKVCRFVRVACPARGTTLASGRLDRWLSVLSHIAPEGVLGDSLDFLLAVVKERTDPRTLPGLEAMMPGSALTRLLAHPALVTDSDLSVIAGDIEGDSLWGQIKLLVVDWFYGADHDLVVNTGSMYGGIRRPPKSTRFQFDQGPDVCHFKYFANDKSVRWLVSGLTRADGSDGGFQPLLAAKQEEPKWRDAVRRSRGISTPRPLAVVIPGTMGSVLQVADDAIWMKYWPLFKGGLGRLAMGAVDVRPTDVLDDFYGPLLEFLARSHRVEIHPYDWRLSVRDAAEKLADKLTAWLPEIEQQGQPVHFVAHSMGGLVVRAMIADGGRGTALWRRILALPNSRFMMLGTPNLGSHEAVRWLTATNPTQAKLSLLDITHNADEITDIVNRYPGLLELLPFDDASPNFSQQSLWTDLKRQLAAHWSLADATALSQARDTWDFLKLAAPDPEHMIYIAGSQPATVVAYELADYEESYLIGRKRLSFVATREGDGTVAWSSGRLPGVKTWYVEDTAHDELCKKKSAFSGYLDLLTTGATTRLSATPPSRSRAAAGEAERFLLPTLPPTDDIPGEASLQNLGFGISRPFDEEAAGHGVPLIRIRLCHGNLAYAKHAILVGHYLGDAVVSAEKALDERLNEALSRRQLLGLYPERLGSHALFFNENPAGKPGGAVVIGLGQVGELSPGLLTKSVRDAMLDYALRVAQWPDERFGARNSVRSAALTCLLVGAGTRAGGLTVRDSVEAILRGATAANDKLAAAKLENMVIINEIEFIELFEDVAISAAEALNSILKDGELAMKVTWPDGTIEEGQGRQSRVRWDESPGWWQRMEVIEDEDSDTLRFIATTDRARAEETLATGQLRLAEGFIRQASQSSYSNAEVAKTLFEMLLPNRMKELAPKQADLVLLVDTRSARYPWELLEDRWSQGNRPPAVAAGLVRQLKTPNFRPHPAHASEANALVVGNPDLAGWKLFCDLPGARQEAQSVANLLASRGYHVEDCIDEKADAILTGLHQRPWRILHLAGHGEHCFQLEAEELATAAGSKRSDAGKSVPKRVSGMVIGQNTFLTPGDVQQMRWVPELVFINCCHLGKTLGETASQGKFSLLAANLAVEFIEMGVKAVIAAGWAVDDGAAEAFASSFYDHMLEGSLFGEAVRAAREEIWVRFPKANTWGAYQCYGDPGYRLHNNGGDTEEPDTRTYFVPAELVSELRNYSEWVRMQIKESGDAPEKLDALRGGIVAKLKGIPDKVRDKWLKRGDVAAALGLAWGETKAWAEGIAWLEKAQSAEKGDCPMRAVEQCANYRVRLCGEQWQEMQAADSAAAARPRLVEEIKQAIRELDSISTTPERLNLLGSAWKRKAWLLEDPAARLRAVGKMVGYYRKALDLCQKPDPYPFTNWATGKALVYLLDTAPRKSELDALANDCRHMIQIAQERNQKNPDFWGSVAEPDIGLVLLLAHPEQPEADAQAEALRIARLYRSAAQRGASPREYGSVKENLDFVIALTTGTRLDRPLAVLRANL